jgi:hypothetical protein
MENNKCRHCGYPIIYQPFGRWQHVGLRDTWDGCWYVAVWERRISERDALIQYGHSQAEPSEGYMVGRILERYEM